MENGESSLQGALRETQEESNVVTETGSLITVISLPTWNQVHLFYQIDMVDNSFSTTPESNQVELFTEQEIPWEQLAFKTVEKTLQHFFQYRHTDIPVLNDSITL